MQPALQTASVLPNAARATKTQFYTIQQVADMFKVHPATIYRAIEEDILRVSMQISERVRRISQKEIDKLTGFPNSTQFHTPAEVASILKIRRASVDRGLWRGSIRSVQLSPRVRRIAQQELDRIAEGESF